MPNYLIAAGGTGGHIYPGIAIADKIRENEKESNILFCGTAFGMESKLVPAAGYELLAIDAKGFAIKSPVKIVKALIAFFKGKKQAARIIRDRKIDLVIGTGGYVCGPVLAAARTCGVRTLIHEQNSFPGKANRFFAAGANCVCISFAASDKYFSRNAKLVVTGNPVRSVFRGMTREQARELLKIDRDDVLLFVTGGSLGSRSINNTMTGMIKSYFSLGYRVIMSSGPADYTMLKKNNSNIPVGIFDIREYIPDQHLYLAAADLIVCRAGAITCSEIAVLGKPSVMIPYPYAAGDHQRMNAMVFQRAGASVMISDKDLTPEVLYETIRSIIFDKSKLKEMGESALTLAFPDAADHIYNCVRILVSKKEDR